MHLAAHRHVLGQDLAMDVGLVADHQAHAVDIAFHAAVDLNVAGRVQRAVDDQIGTDDGRRGRSARVRLGWTCRDRRRCGGGASGASLLLLENMAACLDEIAGVSHDIVIPDFIMDMRPGAAARGTESSEGGAFVELCVPTCTLIAERWP